MQHPNIVRYHAFQEHAIWHRKSGESIEVAYIVQDLVTGGELYIYFVNDGPFSDNLARHYFKTLLATTHFVHTNGFSHRDIKPQNILINENFELKMIDFGFVSPLGGTHGQGFNYTHVGTPGFMAPELLA